MKETGSLTGKVFIGGGNLEHNFGIAIRPWPLFIGPQTKLGRFSFSFEMGFADALTHFILDVQIRYK